MAVLSTWAWADPSRTVTRSPHTERNREDSMAWYSPQQRGSCRSNIINTRSLDAGSQGPRGCLSVGLITVSGLILLQIKKPGSLGSREHTAGIHFVPGWIDTRELGISILGPATGKMVHQETERERERALFTCAAPRSIASTVSTKSIRMLFIIAARFLRWIPRKTQVHFVSSLYIYYTYENWRLNGNAFTLLKIIVVYRGKGQEWSIPIYLRIVFVSWLIVY